MLYCRPVRPGMVGLNIAMASILPKVALAAVGRVLHASAMFMVTEVDAAAIRTVLPEESELSAVIELRRRFPGIAGHAEARACVRTIAGWHQPPPARPCAVVPLHPGKRR